MSRKKRIILGIGVFVLLLSLIVFGIPVYKNYKIRKEAEEEHRRIENATILVELKEDLKIPFYQDAKASDYIVSLNGDLLVDSAIDTTLIGKQEAHFIYRNEEGIKIPYSYIVEVIDDVAPSIWLNSTYTVYTSYNGNLVEDIVCADNYDDTPTCLIEGEYTLGSVGSYPLTFVARDFSGNETRKDFTLLIKEVPKPSSESTTSTPHVTTEFLDIVKKHKTDKTKIGIDVSGWQGEIDFEKVKEAGVEFVFIKVGGTLGTDGDYYVDSKFIRNIEGFQNVGIPVGIYFYSYAKSDKNAIEDAYWVLEQIKEYDISLPIVYDWENWSYFNNYEQSFYTLSKHAKMFLDIMKKNGYEGMLYSSKNYLERAWLPLKYPVWLAHYTEKSSYSGPYTFWQLCDNGVVDGIEGDVDIDIWYQ